MVFKLSDAKIFLEPVDPVKLNLPTYTHMIKKPMDLGSVKKKLNLNIYQSAQDFLSDIKLVFDNCKLFNGT